MILAICLTKALKVLLKAFYFGQGTLMDQIYLLPVVFGVSFLLAATIYLAGGKMQPKKTSQDVRKTESYACGENLPIAIEDLRVDMERFLMFAVYFLIFDVLAFTIATSFFTLGLVPIAYALIVLTAVAMLVIARRHQ
jgi:NADH:ubiquinone oxidoreductase subunit 3 (subunit A)